MTDPHDRTGDGFEGWLEDRLDTVLGVQASAPPPANARYLDPRPRRLATPLRVGLATGAAVLAIGGGAAYATGLVPGTSVSQSAQSCSAGTNDSHGDCVSTAAHTSSTSSSTSHTSSQTNNDTHGDAVSNAAHTCPTSPPGAHGQCVSAIASGGRNTAHTRTTTSTTGAAAHGEGVSGVGQSGPHAPGTGTSVTSEITAPGR